MFVNVVAEVMFFLTDQSMDVSSLKGQIQSMIHLISPEDNGRVGNITDIFFLTRI